MAQAAAAIIKTGVAWTVQLLIVTLVVGLFLRRRHRACYSFVLYLLGVLIGEKGFYSRSFWLFKELMLNLLKFAVALELAYRTFRSFPGARSTARSVLFVLVAVTLVSVVAVTPQISAVDPDDQVLAIVGRLQPRALNGTVWLLTGMAALILWYRLPVDRFHKAIFTGFVPYLLVFTIGLNAMESYGFSKSIIAWRNAFDTSAYLLLLAYWTRAAWAPLAAPAVARGPAPVLERQ